MEEDKKLADDNWAKEHGFVLVRDSCKDCQERWQRGDRTVQGDVMFCSMAHAHEVSTLRRGVFFDDKKKLLLSAINTDILSLAEAEQLINDIEDRYY